MKNLIIVFVAILSFAFNNQLLAQPMDQLAAVEEKSNTTVVGEDEEAILKLQKLKKRSSKK